MSVKNECYTCGIAFVAKSGRSGQLTKGGMSFFLRNMLDLQYLHPSNLSWDPDKRESIHSVQFCPKCEKEILEMKREWGKVQRFENKMKADTNYLVDKFRESLGKGVDDDDTLLRNHIAKEMGPKVADWEIDHGHPKPPPPKRKIWPNLANDGKKQGIVEEEWQPFEFSYSRQYINGRLQMIPVPRRILRPQAVKRQRRSQR